MQTSPSPGLGFDAVVTERDNAVTIHLGQKLEVVLHARAGMTDWSNVHSSDTSVLTPIVNPAATAVHGVGSPRTQGEASEFVGAVTLAAFQAQATGQSVITATAGALCSPGQACPMFAVLYSVTVTVA